MAKRTSSVVGRLWLAVLSAVLVLSGIGVAGSYLLWQELERSDQALKTMSARVKMAARWYGLTELNAARTMVVIKSSDAELIKDLQAEMTATSNAISQLQKALEDGSTLPEHREQLARVAEARKTMLAQRNQIRQLREEGKAEDAQRVLVSTYVPAVQVYLEAISTFLTQQEDAYEVGLRQSVSERRMLMLSVAAAALVTFILLLIGARSVIRSIRVPLQRANEVARRTATGDLSRAVTVDRQDEFGQLLSSLEAMRQSLGEMVRTIGGSTDSVMTASAQIAAGSMDLSHRTETTASELQTTAAAMEQLGQSLQQCLTAAVEVSASAGDAAGVARDGGALMNQVVTVMDEIHSGSRKVAEIVAVIDGIAFQTNILALNAAVEAARAGEQGRGFAVVAAEVRTLAKRSSDAAREIRGIIDQSVHKIADGTSLVSKAGNTVGSIVSAVDEVRAKVEGIRHSIEEQNLAVHSVNQAVSKVDGLTQQNAALVEESAAAAQSLSDQARQLGEAISYFRTDSSGTGSTVTATAS